MGESVGGEVCQGLHYKWGQFQERNFAQLINSTCSCSRRHYLRNFIRVTTFQIPSRYYLLPTYAKGRICWINYLTGCTKCIQTFFFFFWLTWFGLRSSLAVRYEFRNNVDVPQDTWMGKNRWLITTFTCGVPLHSFLKMLPSTLF